MTSYKRTVYVVLHYLAEKETKECVESILEATNKSKIETKIVVVDNGSDNRSGENIAKYFDGQDNVKVLFTGENLGFANGINYGFMYAKRVMKADFIVAINNDTVIQQDDFNEVIVQKYRQYNFAVMGPDIITKDGKHQNPVQGIKWNRMRLYRFRFKKRMQYILAHFGVFNGLLKINDGAYLNKRVDKDVLNPKLHGACLIFSPDYIREFDGLFAGTFLYMEEDILKLRLEYAKMVSVYTPDLVIFHEEDVATNMLVAKSLQKKKGIYKNLLASSKEYMKLTRKQSGGRSMRRLFEKMASKQKGIKYRVDERIPGGYLFGVLFMRLKMRVRGLLRLRRKVFVGKKVTLQSKKMLAVERGVTIGDRAYIDALSSDGVRLLTGSKVGDGTVIRCSGNLEKIGKGFRLGRNSALADDCFVGATGGVWIGDNTICGQGVRFHASNHKFDNLDEPIKNQGVECKGIYVGNNCWIGAGAVLLDGVTVGDGCVIGANAVVTKDISENSVVAGVPAKIIRKRGAK